MQKLRALLPGSGSTNSSAMATQGQSVNLEPEVGFQISIEKGQHTTNGDGAVTNAVRELNVHLIAARHLPALFGFKLVQGYVIKVKLFPGSKRLDSSVQTNSWPKFNETFKFPLVPDLKPALKHSPFRNCSKAASEFTPEEILAGQFVVFTVYALLELPPASLNRFNKTYRSLRDKSSNLVQKIAEGSNKSKDDKENGTDTQNGQGKKAKRKSSEVNPRDSMPPLTISEARRNIGSVTCYLEPKMFKLNARSGVYSSEELWLPIKDITTSVAKNNNNNSSSNNLANSAKGVVEIALEVRDLSENPAESSINDDPTNSKDEPGTPTSSTGTPSLNASPKNPQWNRMTSEVKRKMGLSNASRSQHDLVLRITTARMRCSHKAKDELEATAGSVYLKTTVFEHGIYIDSWKSPNFYPSLSTKWDVGEAATLSIPLRSCDTLEHMLIRTTLATKTKMGKKLVLGTVLVGAAALTGNFGKGSGAAHMAMLREAPFNERVPMWHSYQ